MTKTQEKPERLALEGTLTVRNAEETHAKLADVLRRHGDIEVDCTTVVEADLSLVQLLLAARKSARQAGKTLVLAAPAAGALHQVLVDGGFLSAVQGFTDPDDAFWLKGRDAR